MDFCKLCGAKLSDTQASGPLDTKYQVECPRCGNYIITSRAVDARPDDFVKEQLHLISAVARWHSERGVRFLIADVTGHRQGVCFEAGFAMGLGLPVIWTCRKDQMKACHFDTRQYNHIPSENPEELRQRLRDRILATMGNAPKR